MKHQVLRPNGRPSAKGLPSAEELGLFSNLDLFRGLPPKKIASLLKGAELHEYPSGSLIFTPEDASTERLFILKSGQVERYRLTPDGKRLVTGQISPGGVFGIMGLLGRTMQGNFAEATIDASAYVLTRDRVLRWLRREPDFALSILENLGDRVRLLEERLVEAAYSSASARLAHYLLGNAERKSGVLANQTHEQIGNSIGAVRQTVTERLADLTRQGLISVKPKQIKIIDRPGLEKIARG